MKVNESVECGGGKKAKTSNLRSRSAYGTWYLVSSFNGQEWLDHQNEGYNQYNINPLVLSLQTKTTIIRTVNRIHQVMLIEITRIYLRIETSSIHM